MRDLANLLAHCFDDLGSRVTDGSSQHAAETIEIASPVGVPDVHPFAAFERNRMVVICSRARPDIFFLFGNEVGSGGCLRDVMCGHWLLLSSYDDCCENEDLTTRRVSASM